MSIPILATKLYIPTPPQKMVFRPRLIERLNESLCQEQSYGQKLTLISAPAGFGKTTLLSEWIPGCKRSVAWLSLDEADNDLTRFLVYFVSAMQTIVPGIGEEIMGMLLSPQPPPTESILTTLLNEITAIPNDFIFILDDYHLIDAEPVDNALTFLIEHLPQQMHLVITTREDPNLPLARLRVRSQLTELRIADLRFTPSEAAEFFNHSMGFNLSVEDISTLESRTEGWIAGLQLAALSLQGQKDVSGLIQTFAGDHRYIVDYLVEEVLHRQTASIRDFLLQTSILDRLNGSLCDAVTGQKNSRERLVALQRGNFFLIPLDDRRHWYRYHHLFADVLHMYLMTEQADQVPALHQRASEWYEQNGSATDSILHALAGNDFDRAAKLLETTWQTMYESFQSAAWLDWVKHLPEELIRTRPVLCTQIAWGLMNAHEVDASMSRLRDAERCLEGPSDKMVVVDQEQFRSLRARIAFARAYNAQTLRDFLSAIKYAEQTIQLIPEENQSLRAQTTAILGATYLINGDLNAANRSMDVWIEHSLKAGDFYSAIGYAMAEKADILAAQGHLREALRTYQLSIDLASEHDHGVQRVMAHHYLGMATLYHEMGDDQAADHHFQKSLGLAGLHMSVDWSYRRCVTQARFKESNGELEAAIDYLDEAKRFYIKTLIPHIRPIEAMKARIYLKQGRLSKAKEWAQEQGISADDELSYYREYEHITLARLLLAVYQDNRDERVILKALNLLERLLKAGEDRNRKGSVLEILVTQALVYQGQGNTPRALTMLERALTLAEPEGYLRLFVNEGQPMAQLLREAAARGILPDYINRLLAGFEVKQQEMAGESALPELRGHSTPMPQSLIEPLSHRELEVLRLFKTDLLGPEIAEELVIALSTVRTHTKSIYSKLNVTNRQAAVKRAAELGLV